MKLLPKFNIGERYRTDLRFSRPHNDKNLDLLVNHLKLFDNPIDNKDILLSMLELYFNRFFDNNVELTPKRQETFNQLLSTTRTTVSSFYRGEGVDIERVREEILPIAEIIKKPFSRTTSKNRHLHNGYNEVYNSALVLEELPELYNLDTIVAVATGAFEPALLAQDILEAPNFVPVRYSLINKKDSRPRIIEGTEEETKSSIKKKKVLTVEDWAASGATLEGVIRFVLNKNPSKLYGTSVIGNSMPGLYKNLRKDPFYFRKR